LDKEYIKLASVYNRQQKYKESIEAYKRAISENPKNENTQFLLIFTKDQYYKDVDTRIKLYENFKNKFPKSKYKDFIDYRIAELKEDKFLKKD
jgi:tetratricopeptide (TPR) repeat protein